MFDKYDFEHTDINLDWTSLILYGDKCKLGKYGYSRDHRPDKKQIVLGLAELASPINVPIGLTVKAGNINDTVHSTHTYGQVRDKLRQGSMVVFDKGVKGNKLSEPALNDKMKYLTAKMLNKSDDKRIKVFDRSKAELVDPENGVYGIKYVKPNKKPLRVWSVEGIYSAVLISYLAQLFISLMQYEIGTVRHTSTKFIKILDLNQAIT